MALPILGVALLLSAHAAQTAPIGWRTERLDGGAIQFTPGDLKKGETFRVAVYPSAPLGGATIEAWTRAQIARDAAPPARAASAPELQNGNGEAAVLLQAFGAVEGHPVFGIYTGIKTSGGARLMRVLLSDQPGLYGRYGAQVGELVAAARTAKSESLGDPKGAADLGPVRLSPVYGPLIPKLLADFRLGGPLKEGIYEGAQVYEGKNGTTYSLRIYIWANGEALYTTKGEDDKEFGEPRLGGDTTVSYSEATGRISIGTTYNLNNRSDASDEHTLLLRDLQGVPYIYGRNDRGFNYLRTLLAYKGPVDRPSPSQAKLLRQEAEAEAKRFKWVAPPGQGLATSAIQTVLLNARTITDGMGGANEQSTVYILLKDGTVYDGLPVAPDRLDVSLSRRREPERWGQWKKEGGKLLVLWKDSGGKWSPLEGEAMKPGTPATKLEGRYGTGRSSVNIGGSSWALWGITFGDGRFVKDSRGGAGNSAFMQTGGMPAINTVYDDDGSSTSAVGDGLVVATTREGSTRRTRTGTYTVEGYALVLRYDDGRVVRHPFFVSPDGAGIWFEGAYLVKSPAK